MSARLPFPDLLRGFALLGIAVANMPALAQPLELTYGWGKGPADAWANVVQVGLFQYSFYILFSFLFGFGFAEGLDRFERAGHDFRNVYFRRILGLLALGLIHAVFVFFGDVLGTYALLGALLWFARRWSAEVLRKVGLTLLILGMGWAGLMNVAMTALEGVSFFGYDPAKEDARAIAGYQGGFWSAVGVRWEAGLGSVLGGPFVIGLEVLGLFALGMWASRTGLMRDPAPWLARHRGRIVLAAGFGLLFSGLAAYAGQFWSKTPGHYTLAFLDGFASPLLAWGYFALLAWLWASGRLPAWLADAWERTGRMSLTVYLGISIVGSLVFNGYGLGLYNRLGPAAVLGISLATYVGLVLFANLWSRKLGMGPFERLLRAWTYLGRRPDLTPRVPPVVGPA